MAGFEKKLGASCGANHGAGLLHVNAEAGNFFTTLRDDQKMRSTVLGVLSRDRQQLDILCDQKRLRGTCNYASFLCIRADSAVAFLARHPADGLLTKQTVTMVPSRCLAVHTPDVSDVISLKDLLRRRVAMAAQYAAYVDKVVRKLSTLSVGATRSGTFSGMTDLHTLVDCCTAVLTLLFLSMLRRLLLQLAPKHQRGFGRSLHCTFLTMCCRFLPK